jgi:hypothetical protein
VPDPERIQLHPSGLSVFDECGERWRRMYEVGESGLPSDALIVGTAVDTAMMADLRSKLHTGKLLEAGQVAELARHAVHQAYRYYNLRYGLEDAVKRTLAFTHYAHERLNPKIQVAAVQEKWSVRLDDTLHRRTKHSPRPLRGRWAKIDFVGTLDIREHSYGFDSLTEPSGYIIRDIKTSGATPPGDAANGKHWVQLTSYALGCWTRYQKLPERVQIDTLVDLKNGIKHALSFGTRDNFDFAALFNRVVRFAQARQAGLYLPAPRGHWRCSQQYCQFYNSCPYTKNKQTVDLAVPALRAYKTKCIVPQIEPAVSPKRRKGEKPCPVSESPLAEQSLPVK